MPASFRWAAAAVLTATSLAVLGVSPAAGAVQAPAPDVMYGGSTRPDVDPFVLVVRGQQVVKVSRMYDASAGCGVMGGNVTVNAPIDAAGRFSILHRERVRFERGVQMTERITGTVGPTSAVGTARVDFRGKSSSGPCHERVQHWNVVHKPGFVFSGVTSQRLPVVVELTPNAHKVHDVHIGWYAPCRQGGQFWAGDLLSNFPLVGGEFGDEWWSQQNDAAAGKVLAHIGVAGRLAGDGSASGRFRIGLAFKRPNGTVGDKSPMIRWTAQS